MPRAQNSAVHRMLVIMLFAVFWGGMQCLAAATAEPAPAAPTIPDAHQFFESLVAGNGVTALYETRSKTGEFIGYESFPVLQYRGDKCNSEMTLRNGVKINFDWSLVEKPQASDGTLSIWHRPEVLFKFFHMVSLEGGIVVEPSNPIPRLIFGITDELSRNRLVKAIDLVSSACRSKTKFD